MKIISTIFFTVILSTAALCSFAQPDSKIALPVDETDSLENIIDKDETINDIIKKNSITPAEKVEYYSRLTRYGFKNLFVNKTYSPSLPYTQQVNPHAETYMHDYLQAHGKYLLNMKGWGSSYFTLIDNIFAQYGLPKELKYLAVIESNLQSTATSWVGAGGPWQFMPYTAREYGLVVNGSYDERRDYYKSTHAAARYLLYLYKNLHDWLLVIAAYNGGPGRVYSAMKKSGSRNFWNLQYYLPTESRNHVKKFIATHYIMEGQSGGTVNPEYSAASTLASVDKTQAVGIGVFSLKPVLNKTEMENANSQLISGKFNSLVIAKNIVMDITLFNRYNPNFDAMISTNGEYELVLPTEKMQLFMANKYTILNECVQILLGNDEVPVMETVYPKKYRRAGK